MKQSLMLAPAARRGGEQMSWAPGFDSAERQFRQVLDKIEERIIHHCDRPQIEMDILSFVAHAQGPTTDGIATAMNIPRSAAEVHLEALQSAGRIWGQRVRGLSRAWHLSTEGRRFLENRTISF